MRSMNRAALVLILLVIGHACKPSIHAPNDVCPGSDQAPSIRSQDNLMSGPVTPKFVTFVESIEHDDDLSNVPLEVVFFGHPSTYYVERDHPCFHGWVVLLKKSYDEKLNIAFASRGFGGSHIASLEPAGRLTGVVEEIDEGPPDPSIGFTIPGYANLFVIPGDQPQRQAWLGILRQSRDRKLNVVFTCRAHGNPVTSLALTEE